MKAKLLPEPCDEVIATMVEEFKHRHRTGQIDPAPLRAFQKFCPKLAGDYNRYSCDNSSPTSIVDQMVHGLDKAHQEGRFIPWAYVFCDYSVTGLDRSRQGYGSYKKVLQESEHLIETTYVDDFTRPSRDEVEWWRLAHLSRRLQKRMIGASDGFDLSSPNWDMMISVYGLLSRLFIKGLREKVKRGMRGAARRGTCLGKLPLGFTRTAHRDEHGNVVRDKDGVPEYVPCIDPATCDARRLLYELFVDKCWSLYQITKHFNALKVDDWGGWTEGGIRKLLWSASALGVFIWNKTRREYDWEEEKWVVIPNLRKDWVVYYDQGMALVPLAQWKAARKRLAAMRRKCPLTGRKRSRNQKSATTLFSGTLFCECGSELLLYRSTGKYKVFFCHNGRTGAHECQLSTSKSAQIVEKCLLGFLQEKLLTDHAIEELVARANAFLHEEAAKPRLDTAPLKASIRAKEAAIKKLFQRIESCEDEALVQAYERRIAEHQREVNQLKDRLRTAEAQNLPPPAQLDETAVRALLADLRGLLNGEIPVAAETIRTLTGPITIRQEPIPGKKRGARWIATFGADLLRVLRYVAGQNPGSPCLATGTFSAAQAIEVVIDKIPAYEKLAPEFKRLRDNGATVQSIASAHGLSWQYTKDILHFADTGERPKWRAGRRTGNGPAKPREYTDIAQDVAHLRDQHKLSFARIATKLGVSKSTVRRAYDLAHPELAREAAESGQVINRGGYSHLGVETYERIRQLLRAGKKPAEVAGEVGCSTGTVHRVRKQMQADTSDPGPPQPDDE